MAKLYRKPYFDASLFLAWIQGETHGETDRGAIVDHIYRLARRGQFQIYTSSLSLAEVHPAPPDALDAPDAPDTPANTGDDLLLTFLENEFFVMVDLDRTVGEEARRLCQKYSLGPNDAVHLASADSAGCDVLLTFDPALLSITHPRVAIEAPILVGQLSMEIDTALLRSTHQVSPSEL